jgi:magnesium-transporting ATPase (P-type)
VRRNRFIHIVATVTVISSGIVMLIGLASQPGTMPADLTSFNLQLVTVTAAIAVLIGLLNLLAVHLGRFVRTEHGWPYSIIVLLAAVVVIIVWILDRAEVWPDDLEGERVSTRIFEAVQVSLESALAALLVFFLVYAAYRLMRREVTIWHGIFTAALLIVLLGSIPLDSTDALVDIRKWLVEVPVSAGARGLLIGVGLGTVTVGVRVLIGQDRSFRG